MHENLQCPACIPPWHGVTVLVDRYCGVFIDPSIARPNIAIGYSRLIKKMNLLSLKKFGYTLQATSHLVWTVGQTVDQKLFIECFKAFRLRHRNHVVPASKAYQSFHSTFFIAAVRVAKPGGKTVIVPEFAEAFLLNTLLSLENLTDRCR